MEHFSQAQVDHSSKAPKISEANILAGHFSSTRDRFAAAKDFPILILHDTTEFSFRHEDTASIGIVNKIPTSIGKPGPPRFHTQCGILMHSSLVTTRDGLPLGLAAIKFWNRDKFHGANALKRRINPQGVTWFKNKGDRITLHQRYPHLYPRNIQFSFGFS
jgi:hypothetical protein